MSLEISHGCVVPISADGVPVKLSFHLCSLARRIPGQAEQERE